jgi:hypothetical protein
MQIHINDATRIAEVWLTNADQQNPNTQIALKPFFEEYKAKKYTVAVFKSGAGDLYKNTESLILHNFKASCATQS